MKGSYFTVRLRIRSEDGGAAQRSNYSPRKEGPSKLNQKSIWKFLSTLGDRCLSIFSKNAQTVLRMHTRHYSKGLVGKGEWFQECFGSLTSQNVCRIGRRWSSNPSGKCSYERPTRGKVCGTMRSMCGADAGCLAINYQPLCCLREGAVSSRNKYNLRT